MCHIGFWDVNATFRVMPYSKGTHLFKEANINKEEEEEKEEEKQTQEARPEHRPHWAAIHEALVGMHKILLPNVELKFLCRPFRILLANYAHRPTQEFEECVAARMRAQWKKQDKEPRIQANHELNNIIFQQCEFCFGRIPKGTSTPKLPEGNVVIGGWKY